MRFEVGGGQNVGFDFVVKMGLRWVRGWQVRGGSNWVAEQYVGPIVGLHHDDLQGC